jgi:4-hydroxy-3-methylbut-2-enyl diphosphate reductase
MANQIVLAEPRGFCAGVEMAIKALTWMVQTFDEDVYCFHEIVHNATVVKAFEDAGVIFVNDIAEVPDGAPIMLSAHGSAPEVVSAAREKSAVLVDAVCPLVTKVHHEVKKMARDGFDILYVGHTGHDEAVGTIAEAPEAITLVEPETGLAEFSAKDPAKVALLAQTTLGMYEWEEVLDSALSKYPGLKTARKSDLCYATTNRQSAVKQLAAKSDVILVVGSENSSNTQALVRVAQAEGVAAYRVDGPGDIEPSWIADGERVGVTAGASAPDQLVKAVIAAVDEDATVETLRVTTEDEYFPLPRDLRGFLSAIQAAVEAGYAAKNPGQSGLLEKDREWTAADALDLLP